VKRSAVLSDDDRYRYKLVRRWASGRGFVTFLMLNPSTADALKDDATIRRCIGFAKLWGYPALHVINLYALRSTDPKGLWKVEDPVGPKNDAWLAMYAKFTHEREYPLVAAWGNNAHPQRVEDAYTVMFPHTNHIQCLGVTGKDMPLHPLRLAKNTELIDWP
jgi:hypothetical protein